MLLLAVAVLYYLHFNSPKNLTNNSTNIEDTSQTNLTEFEKKIVFINTDTLWNKYLYVEEMMGSLLDEKSKLEADYERKLKAFEQEVQLFQQRAPYFSERQGKIEQERLLQQEQELMMLKEELSMQLAQSEQNKNKILQEAIFKVLDDYNQEHQPTLVFSTSILSDVLYAKPQMEITNEIVKRLNEAYEKNKLTTK